MMYVSVCQILCSWCVIAMVLGGKAASCMMGLLVGMWSPPNTLQHEGRVRERSKSEEANQQAANTEEVSCD